MIEKDLGDYLAENVALCGGRTHAPRLPRSPMFPGLVYQRVSGVPAYSHDGYSHLTETRYQITGWATGYEEVREMAAQVRTVLDGYEGMMGSTFIGHCLCVADRDIFEAGTGIYQVPLDFMIAFND